MNITQKFAERTVDGLARASRSGVVSREDLLRRFAAALLVLHERSDDPGAQILANYGLREMPEFLAGEQSGGRFRITYELCAVRNQDKEGNFNLGLDTGDIMRLVAEMEPFEDYENLSISETAFSESEVLP